MKMPLFASLVLSLGLLATTGRAQPNPEIVPLGDNTYALTHWANNGFTRNTESLKSQALEDARAYCAKHHKQLKVLSTTAKHPLIPLTGFAYAKIEFKALDASDPELRASASIPAPAPTPTEAAPETRTATDVLYSDLMKLDELRKRGLLTEEEFQAKRRELVEKSN